MKVVCFDLDDTLYKEIDYLYEGYRVIASVLWGNDWKVWFLKMIEWYSEGDNVFEKICKIKKDVTIDGLLNIYRYDVHNLFLPLSTRQLLTELKSKDIKIGIITDGREITQNNKIRALGLDKYFDEDMILISETFGTAKPDVRNYMYFVNKYPKCREFIYVGDNICKDFITPNKLGWTTVCLLDDGNHIHKQNFNLPGLYQPNIKIYNIEELLNII